MKKVILSVAVALATLVSTQVSAQDYKPVAGDNTLELQFAPLGGSPLTMGGIRYRRFIADKTALRATVYVGYSSTTTITQQEDNDPANAGNPSRAQELKDKERAFEIGIRPGIEKHFEGTSRLSPYIGAELDFATRSTKSMSESQTPQLGGAQDKIDTYTQTNGDYAAGTATGYTRFGLNALFGADYYVAEKVFLGAELGFGFSLKKDKAIKESSTADGFVAGSDIKGGSTFTLAPNVLAQFRLGVVF